MPDDAVSDAHAEDALNDIVAGDDGRLTFRGTFDVYDVPRIAAKLDAASSGATPTFDLGKTRRIDTAVAWVLLNATSGGGATVEGAQGTVARTLETVAEALPRPDAEGAAHPPTLTDRLAEVGRAVTEAALTGRDILGVLGLFLARLAVIVVHPRRFPLTALVHHCEAVGLRAVGIVALMGFLIGVVLAFQGAAQLRQFGAEVFVVDLIAISILRELGVLLTAIIVAGRTASAFTAAIGSMKMREEIDAMRTLGIDPATALILPRVLALVLMLPILTLIADVSGIIGGLVMSWIELGISPAMFLTRLVEGTGVSHALIGFSKAPVFAVVIGVIGCHAGLQVERTSESLGSMTSRSVVTAIFSVIVIDALFSIFYAELGL